MAVIVFTAQIKCDTCACLCVVGLLCRVSVKLDLGLNINITIPGKLLLNSRANLEKTNYKDNMGSKADSN